MDFDLVIKNGTIVTAERSYRADVGVRGERIAAIGENLSGASEIDAAGKLVTPGAVDIHVHMQMPLPSGVVSADTFFTGTRAAAFGGTTTIIDFVAPAAGQDMMDALAERRAEADGQVVIDYGLHMTVGPAEMARLSELPAVFEAGCTSFKLYMAYGFRLDDSQLLEALEAVAGVGGLPVVHAENWDIISTLVARNLAAGRTEPRWHPRSRPALMEGEAAGRVIDLATLVGTPLHIFHVSCAETVERIAAARSRGLPVTGETCPQYLLLTDVLYERPGIEGALPVCAPPLRSEADQQRLWQALARDELQLVATDHCPFSSADKALGQHDFSLIPGGVPSIEMRFAAIYSGGVRPGYLSPNRWVDICCTTPARLLNLAQKGSITVGNDADLVVFDPNAEVTLSSNWLHENVDWTPYEGLVIQDWPAVTISRGRVLVENGEFKGAAGHGRFLKRALS